MKRQEGDIVVERSGQFEEQAFGIDDADVALILEIVRNKLYTNKVGSFVREIISNAYDAMVDAGTLATHPIRITLPTSGNKNTITIRDHGTGIEHDNVMKLYTRVGKSTRSNSNSFVGMMGIGRLVGFSLTDSFNVISYFNGVKSEYLCYIDETKRGKVALLSTAETDEHNGLAVKVNIEPSQQSEFFMELRNFIQYIADVKFEITNNDDQWGHRRVALPSNDSKEVLFQGAGWRKYTSDPRSSRGYIKMGIVIYPLDYRYTSAHVYNDGAVVFDVGIGDVDVAASREGLEYTPKTIKVVEDLTKKAVREVRHHVETQISNAKTVQEALLEFKKHGMMYRLTGGGKILYTNPENKAEVDVSKQSDHRYGSCVFRFKIGLDGKNVIKNGKNVIEQVESGHDVYEIGMFSICESRRERHKSEFKIDPESTRMYYRMVQPNDFEKSPDVKRCRTLTGNTGKEDAKLDHNTFTVYNMTERGLDHFIKMNGFDPRPMMKDFNALAETNLPRLPKGESRPVTIVHCKIRKQDKAETWFVTESEDVTADIESLEPGIWVTKYYSKILYRRTPSIEVEQLMLNQLISQIATHQQKDVNMYIVPANIGRMLDEEWSMKDTKDFDDLVPAFAWVENMLTTTNVLDTFTECSTGIEVNRWYLEKAQEIVNKCKRVKPKTPVMEDVLTLFRRALTPVLPGQMRVHQNLFNFIKEHHNKDASDRKNPHDLLIERSVEIYKSYPLFPEEIRNFNQIEEFMTSFKAYDDYVYALDLMKAEGK